MNKAEAKECNKILSKDGYLTVNEIQFLLEKIGVVPENKKGAIK